MKPSATGTRCDFASEVARRRARLPSLGGADRAREERIPYFMVPQRTLQSYVERSRKLATRCKEHNLHIQYDIFNAI